MKRLSYIFAFVAIFSIFCNAQPKREFRAAWLTTVWAIDWPTTWGRADKGLEQQNELKAIVDSLYAANMNAVFFQVRGFSDAMYNSQYEPWSQYLTGTRGGQPTYDPLQVLVDYAHQKGIEVHAWMNPYRYSTSEATHGTLPTDYANTHPEWLCNCGGIQILNPCLPDVKKRIQEVVADVVSNYDVDGVIFDDYFYQSGYQNSYDDAYYSASGTTLSRADWRRLQINEMVRMVHDTIQAIKPYVHFGIGPAGIAGKANTSAGVYGVEPCPVGSDWQYNGIYADPLGWLNAQTIDYLAPQCYWTIGSSNDYDVLSDWWSKMASHFGRHVYPSQEVGSRGNSASVAEEIGREMILDREHDRMGAPGCCWYSLKTGIRTDGFIRYIRNNVNPTVAVVPQMSWLKQDTVLFVSSMRFASLGSGKTVLTWNEPMPNLRYVVYQLPSDTIGQPGAFFGGEFVKAVVYSNQYEVNLSAGGGTYAVAVLDRYGNEYPARVYNNTVIGDATPATLTYPADAATPLLPTFFSWNKVAGADSYFVQFSRNSDFSTLDYERETADTCFFTADVLWLKENVTYYWRVVTRAANSRDAISAASSFTCSYFKITSPQSEERDCSTSLTFTCDSVPSSSAVYTFEVSSQSSFTESTVLHKGVTSAPRYTMPESILLASSFYYVRATVSYAGITSSSDPVRFRTAAQAVPIPEIISPAQGDTIYGTEVTVRWKEQLSSGFRVEMATATSFAGRVTKAATEPYQTFSHTYTGIQPGTYYLRVKAVADGVYTDPSPVVTIYVAEEVQQPDRLNSNAAVSSTRKVVENGQVIIIRDGVRYTLLGTKL